MGGVFEYHHPVALRDHSIIRSFAHFSRLLLAEFRTCALVMLRNTYRGENRPNSGFVPYQLNDVLRTPKPSANAEGRT